jgi:hypothetical protein
LLAASSGELGIFSRKLLGTLRGQVTPDPTIDNRFIVIPGMDTCTAFFCIADVLKLACCQDTGFNITALTNNLPPALAPTLKQQIIPHRPYVDMLPWASFRDRLLNSPMAVNELEFLSDMASGDLRVWGSVAWDPMAWEVGPKFASKWWFLMDDVIINTTNFWRSQRGEEALVLAQS